MPIYEYLCGSCGLRFERMKSMSRSDEAQTCTDCGEPAKKLMSASSFTFSHTPVGGPRPQNTGVHSIDYNADRIIGRDAERKWKVAGDRQAHKRGVIRDNPGSTGFDLSRTHDGGYRVMRPEERTAAEAGRTLHKKAMTAIEATKSPPKVGEG